MKGRVSALHSFFLDGKLLLNTRGRGGCHSSTADGVFSDSPGTPISTLKTLSFPLSLSLCVSTYVWCYWMAAISSPFPILLLLIFIFTPPSLLLLFSNLDGSWTHWPRQVDG